MDFIKDTEKMRDFRFLSKEEFLNSYSYLTEENYNATEKKLPEGFTRVAVCEYTNKEVLQKWTGTEWLCLHNNNEVIDQAGVDGFKAGFSN